MNLDVKMLNLKSALKRYKTKQVTNLDIGLVDTKGSRQIKIDSTDNNLTIVTNQHQKGLTCSIKITQHQMKNATKRYKTKPETVSF
jgi:hypothetical protein